MSAIAYMNGSFFSGTGPQIPVTDTGFVLGATVAEQVRTCGGQPFRLDSHLDRLLHGLDILQLPSPLTRDEWKDVVQQVVAHNHRLLSPGDDLGVTLFVTPGTYSAYTSSPDDTTATYCVHTYPLPFRLWHERYNTGCTLQSVSIQQVSPRSWPVALKCRSRMHYYLATQEARQRKSGAMAILLDETGHVTETPTANIVALVPQEGLVSPSRDHILPGISLAVLAEIADSLGSKINYRPLRVEELQSATEVLVTSTPFCILPVAEVDGRRLSPDRPMYSKLLQAWNQLADLDLAAQAEKFSQRRG